MDAKCWNCRKDFCTTSVFERSSNVRKQHTLCLVLGYVYRPTLCVLYSPELDNWLQDCSTHFFYAGRQSVVLPTPVVRLVTSDCTSKFIDTLFHCRQYVRQVRVPALAWNNYSFNALYRLPTYLLTYLLTYLVSGWRDDYGIRWKASRGRSIVIASLHGAPGVSKLWNSSGSFRAPPLRRDDHPQT